MAGRHGVRYDERPERQNEYFVPGEGISREVIQADICRYLGNDALVRPGVHQVRISSPLDIVVVSGLPRGPWPRLDGWSADRIRRVHMDT